MNAIGAIVGCIIACQHSLSPFLVLSRFFSLSQEGVANFKSIPVLTSLLISYFVSRRNLKNIQKLEIRKLLSNIHTWTRLPLVEIDEKTENRDLLVQFHLFARPPLLKSTRKAEIRNLLFNFHSSTRPPLVEIDKKSRNQKSIFNFHLFVKPPLSKSTRTAEIRNLLFNFYSLTRPPLVEIDENGRNQKSTFQFPLIH